MMVKKGNASLEWVPIRMHKRRQSHQQARTGIFQQVLRDSTDPSGLCISPASSRRRAILRTRICELVGRMI